MTILALLMAAGQGERLAAKKLAGERPKQYLPLLGQSILARSVAVLRKAGLPVRVVIAREHQALYDEASQGMDLPPPLYGGKTRQESVRLALEQLPELPERILIHDAARSLLSQNVLTDLLQQTEAAIVAVPVVDSLKRSAEHYVQQSIARDHMWQAQTPQIFPAAQLLALHQQFAQSSFTDDAGLFEAAQHPVRIVLGDADNFKITTPADLHKAERLLLSTHSDIRVGFGYDVHALVPGDGVWLGGIKIPHSHKLDGHSDADVLLHAITDALLGTLADGDIGVHFPPTDMRWRGAASAQFVQYALNKLTARGGIVRHVDCTILAEAPKINPHRQAMLQNLASLLALPLSRLGLKATTTEKLGFVGRNEGIAAQAVVTVSFADE